MSSENLDKAMEEVAEFIVNNPRMRREVLKALGRETDVEGKG